LGHCTAVLAVIGRLCAGDSATGVAPVTDAGDVNADLPPLRQSCLPAAASPPPLDGVVEAVPLDVLPVLGVVVPPDPDVVGPGVDEP